MGFLNYNTKPQEAPRPKDFELPSGTAIRTDSGYFYIKGRTKIKIGTERILKSWRFERVVYVTEDCAGRYKTQGRMGFREGTVIEDISTREKFLISENKKRKFVSPDTLDHLGVGNSIVVVSHDEAGIHLRGEDL